jgi:hypothetical protein
MGKEKQSRVFAYFGCFKLSSEGNFQLNDIPEHGINMYVLHSQPGSFPGKHQTITCTLHFLLVKSKQKGREGENIE